jgi:hypothetical protein
MVTALLLASAVLLCSTFAMQAAASRAGCAVTAIKGCYEDPNSDRILKYAASGSIGNPNRAPTMEVCAEWCCSESHSGVAGLEDGGQCFCDNTGWVAPPGTLRPAADCAKTHASGNSSQPAGSANRIVVFTAACQKPCQKPPVGPGPGPSPHPGPSPPAPNPWGPGTPNWMPCEVEPAKSMPFCDHTKPTAERVKNLLSLMTQEELCGQTYDKMHPIAKVPSWSGYNWNTECLHGLGGICHEVNGTTRCPSVFPAPPAMGATFNLTIAHELGRVISDEIRAYSNSNGHRSYQNRPIGVSAW